MHSALKSNCLPGKHKTRLIEGQHFRWRLRLRQDIWYADGRGNSPDPGRHSLDTRNYEEALENLKKLDLVEAVRLGKVDPSALHDKRGPVLTLQAGLEEYMRAKKLPKIAGGIKASSVKRYRPVFAKFLPFLEKEGVGCWNFVKRHHLESYAAWLDGEQYAYATEFLELTCIKQAILYLISKGLLPPECRIIMPLTKPDGTDTYCYRLQEVMAMLELCSANDRLRWMRNLIAGLAFTGMRISELAGLCHSDIDLSTNFIKLPDEGYSRRAAQGKARTTKSSRSRQFPIQKNLRAVLETLVLENGGRQRLFTGPNGNPLRPDYVRICLKRDVLAPLATTFPSSEEEIGFKDGRLHSFRHFFCSFCANSEVREPSVMDWLGHRSSAMVRRYYHLHDDEAQRQMEKVTVNWWPSTT